jgi:hypothetical protein
MTSRLPSSARSRALTSQAGLFSWEGNSPGSVQTSRTLVRGGNASSRSRSFCRPAAIV